MENSRADRILGDWDRISRQVNAPGLPMRRAVTMGAPASMINAAALIVVVVVGAGLWFNLPARVGPPAGEASASPGSTWGPLAVIPPQVGTEQARNEGTLRITEACVYLERAGEVELLFWPADRTTWDAETRAITFENFDGSVVTVRDGDAVILGGGGSSEVESGVSGEAWVRRMPWVAPPASTCSLDTRWGVGAIAHSPAAQQSSGPSASKPAGSGWGALAVVPPQGGADTARNEGTLGITETCVVLVTRGGPVVLVWPADRTTWNAEERSITFANYDGSTVTASDGAYVVVGGSGDSNEESGMTTEAWLARTEWVARPDASCPLEARWWVGALTR